MSHLLEFRGFPRLNLVCFRACGNTKQYNQAELLYNL